MQKVSNLISIIFHPLIMPFVGVQLLFSTNSYVNYTLPNELKQGVLIVVGVSTLVLPLLTIFLLYNRNIITSLTMETKKERIIPYLFTITFYLFSLYLLNKAPISTLIFNFMLGSTLAVLVALIVNLKWKISAHMIGIGGVVGVLFSCSLFYEIFTTYYLVLALLVSGLIGTSRLVLKAHSPVQVYVGFVVGLSCQLAVFYH